MSIRVPFDIGLHIGEQASSYIGDNIDKLLVDDREKTIACVVALAYMQMKTNIMMKEMPELKPLHDKLTGDFTAKVDASGAFKEATR